MEPLTENSIANSQKKDSKTLVNERVSLGSSESQALEKWVSQIREASRGFLEVSKSDLVNFLIRDHKEELSSKEIASIREKLYDPLKHINWISQELKKAFSKNDFGMVAILQAEIKNIEIGGPQASSGMAVENEEHAVPRKKRTPKTSSETNAESKPKPVVGAGSAQNDFSID